MPDDRSPIITKVHYLHFGCILFVIVCIVTTVISLLTKPIDEKHVSIFIIFTFNKVYQGNGQRCSP